jgi:hypothetical protein
MVELIVQIVVITLWGAMIVIPHAPIAAIGAHRSAGFPPGS